MRIKIIVAAGAVLAGGATWAWQSASLSNAKHTNSQVLSEKTENPSPEASNPPAPTPTPKASTNDSTTSTHTDDTDVTVQNHSSQSGSGSNYNSTTTNINVNGQKTTVQRTTVNGQTTETVTH